MQKETSSCFQACTQSVA